MLLHRVQQQGNELKLLFDIVIDPNKDSMSVLETVYLIILLAMRV